MRWTSFVLTCAGALFALACPGCGAHVPDPVAFQNKVFYHYYDPDADPGAFEKRYPPLDLQERQPNPEYIGVSIIGDTIHLSRPKNWVLRTASNKPTERMIEYVSPNQYVFSIYERVDSPLDLWRDVMARYEGAATAEGAELLGSRIPVATWNTQGRGYTVRRFVPGAKRPYRNMSREYLLRSEHRIVLMQIVYPTETIQPVTSELLRVVQTLEMN
jgi:hypothetical protein